MRRSCLLLWRRCCWAACFSTLFAGALADWLGRKPLLIFSGATFIVSIPVIALSHGYAPLFFGRLLQGVSGGLIGVVVPLYLAECLGAKDRGKGLAFSVAVDAGNRCRSPSWNVLQLSGGSGAKVADATALFGFKDQAWRRIFWVRCLPSSVCGGEFLRQRVSALAFQEGQEELALASCFDRAAYAKTDIELAEMEETARTEASRKLTGQASIKGGKNLFCGEVCHSFRAGLHHFVLQHGYRSEFHHRV